MEQSFHYVYIYGTFVPLLKNYTMKRLENKVAVVTGGSTGIGYATAQAFIEEGAKVIITARNAEALAKAVGELGPRAKGIPSDASNIQDITALVRAIQTDYGSVDILFVNAGIVTQEPIGSVTEEAFDAIINTNVKGAIFTTELFIPIMRDGGAIIHNTSVSAFLIAPGTAIYAASKAALRAYSETAAIELAGRKIRVNSIAPAITDTRLIQGNPPEIHHYLQSKFPWKRFAQPVEVAKLVTFLASSEASFITGGEYVIDGGASLVSFVS